MSPGAGVRPRGGDPHHYPNPVPLPSLLGTNFSLRELGLEEVTPPHGTLYRTDIGLPHCGYSLGASSEAELEADAALSPEHPVRLWGRSTRSGRSSCLSSRANSNLTLTDTEHENTETGEWPAQPAPPAGASRPGILISVDFLLHYLGALVKAMENCLALSGQKAEPLTESHEITPPTGDRPETGHCSFLPDEGVPKGQGYGLQAACGWSGGARGQRNQPLTAHSLWPQLCPLPPRTLLTSLQPPWALAVGAAAPQGLLLMGGWLSRKSCHVGVA